LPALQGTDSKEKSFTKAYPTAQVGTHESANNDGTMVTMSTFGTFHHHVFANIQEIVCNSSIEQHPFVVHWLKIKTT
jgi:hypothetical protein